MGLPPYIKNYFPALNDLTTLITFLTIAKPIEIAVKANISCKSTDVDRAVSITAKTDVNQVRTPVTPVPMLTNSSLIKSPPNHHYNQFSCVVNYIVKNK